MSDPQNRPFENNSDRPNPEQPATTSPTSPATRVPFDDEAVEALAVEKKKRMRGVNRMAILGLLALVTLAILPIVKIFFVPVILAATFCTLLHPLYRKVLTFFGNKRGISSFVCCLIILLCMVIPTYIVLQLVVNQAIDLYQSAQPTIKDILAKGGQSEFALNLKNFPLVQKLQLSAIDYSEPLNEAIKALANMSTALFNKTSSGVVGFVFTLFVMFFTMFYFFMDGELLLRRIKYLSPIRNDYEEMIFSRFLLISRATVFGTVIIGITQGTIGSIAMLVFGVKLWLLWGFIMIILSLIPLLGAWMVLIPAGIIQIILGHTWQGIGIILTSILFVSTIDNFMRPRLVGQGAKLHDLVVFFSSLGGIAVFGVMGFIVGPVIAALFVAVLDIYSREFEQQLKDAT
ncbi:MAG: AI-2E family transporter [Chitinispirillaceae bacterium]|nr:AI-2E family transporter [Chitinispirillaceae bacterium]